MSGWWWPGLFVCQDPAVFTCGQAMLNVKNHSTNPHTEDDGGEEDFKMQHFELHVQHFDVP